MLAPVILFVYKRADHTRQVIESLQRCLLAESTDLYVFSDGPRSAEDEQGVMAVRSYLKSVEGFSRVQVVEREQNVGLATNIIEGVSQVMKTYGKVIVIEDDLVFSVKFLQYMNNALDHYQQDEKIFAISGYNPSMKFPADYTERVYLNFRSCSWGWATWADRWAKIDWEVRDAEVFAKDKQQQKLFNRPGEDMTDLLLRQMKGEINSWSIRFSYAQFKHHAYSIYPVHSLVSNIGTDGSGTHSGTTDRYAVKIADHEDYQSFPDNLRVNQEIIREFRKYYRFSIKKKIKKLLTSLANKD